MDLAKVSPGRSVKIREANTGTKNRDEGKLTPARIDHIHKCINKHISSSVRTLDPNSRSLFQHLEASSACYDDCSKNRDEGKPTPARLDLDDHCGPISRNQVHCSPEPYDWT